MDKAARRDGLGPEMLRGPLQMNLGRPFGAVVGDFDGVRSGVQDKWRCECVAPTHFNGQGDIVRIIKIVSAGEKNFEVAGEGHGEVRRDLRVERLVRFQIEVRRWGDNGDVGVFVADVGEEPRGEVLCRSGEHRGVEYKRKGYSATNEG